MKTIAVIVTYSNRFHLLKQVIESILSQDINKIIVIDNNSEPSSKEQLKLFEKQNSEKVKVIYLPENIGSAGGFKRGLQEAYNDSESEFIWLFDDDNIAKKGSYVALVSFYNRKELEKNNSMLISLRSDRKQYYKSIEANDTEILTGKKNSFMTFDFISYIKNKFFTKKTNIKFNQNYGETHQAPYGGMFLHKNLINKIGYPDDRFFVYADDTEYSYRIIKNGGKIYAVLNSLLEDIDISWDKVEFKKNLFSSPILDTPSSFRVYYSFRNRVYFELQNRVENKFVYFFNMIMFFFVSRLLIYGILRFKFKRLGLVLKAIYDGINGNLGKRNV